MANSNYIQNVAIVGAGGNSGSFIAKSLLDTGRHTVTAITRPDSTSKLPDGVQARQVDYDNVSSITDALRGQDALVITLSAFASQEQHDKLVEAAAAAGVPWVLPNEWSPDSAYEGYLTDVIGFQKLPQGRAKIESLGKSSYIAISTGFWYEWSLGIAGAYGFQFDKKEVTLFDEGTTKISTSTWPQVGRAVAGLLSLPIQPEGGDKERCLEHFKNGHVYVSSFTVSQRDMLASVLRVTGTQEKDWKITKEPATQRYKDAIEAMKSGDHAAFARQMYTRIFYPDGYADHETKRGAVNKMLGLPQEDIDEATKIAIKRQKESPW